MVNVMIRLILLYILDARPPDNDELDKYYLKTSNLCLTLK